VVTIEFRIGLVIGKSIDIKKMNQILCSHQSKDQATCRVVLSFLDLDPKVFLDHQISSTEEVYVKDIGQLEADLRQYNDFAWCEVLGEIERHGHPFVTVNGLKYEGLLYHTLDNQLLIFLRDVIGEGGGTQIFEKICDVPKDMKWLVISKKDGNSPPSSYILEKLEQWILKLIDF